ncbi:hypothetical protein FR932_05635 [Moritella marina ATCC 15381]|uniref:Uncharacterized protein n=1 Tax=Moritella marina ATCC 15381 TaxID=1202962 RepID=A0A5J6WH02_MORMI|nr:hypothetical protein [Moritella marina]QFI37346.1 hypothetical protein FR932_05635 [Moritella marina ATCC 15381]
MTFFHSLTHKEQESFQAYRSGTTNNSSFSYDLNHKLKSSGKTPKRFQLHLFNLDNLTLKASLSSEVTLHRACYGDGIQPLLQGEKYKGFLSALDKNNCLGRYFNEHHKSADTDAYYVVIKCPKGSNVAKYNTLRQQVATEYLIPRNSRFTLVSKEEIVDSTEIRTLAGTINARKLKKIIRIELVLKKRNWLKKILRKIAT